MEGDWTEDWYTIEDEEFDPLGLDEWEEFAHLGRLYSELPEPQPEPPTEELPF